MGGELTAAGVFKGAAIGGSVAGVVNVGLYFLGSAMGTAYEMPPGAADAETIPVVMPFIMSLVPGLIGAGVLVALMKFAPKAAWKIFLGLCGVAFVAMLPGPVLQLDGDNVAIVILEVMHVVAVAGVVLGIQKFRT